MMEMPENTATLKSLLVMGFRVILDFKVMGLIILSLVILYMGAWDTAVRPNLEQMQQRDTAIEAQKKELREKQGLQGQYSSFEKQLQVLTTELITVPEGNSSKVISVTEAAELLELAKGNLRDEAVLPPLLPPHDQRADVSLTFVASNTVDLLKGGQVLNQAAATEPAQPPVSSSPGVGGAVATVPSQLGSSTLPVERYDYDLKVTGTYPALMDVLNELVIRKKLVRINKVMIARPATPETQPEAKDFPDFPVKLEMLLSLSLFLYAPVGS
jgi:hypothetical protein